MKHIYCLAFSVFCVIILGSCAATKHVTITCEPSTAAIYVDGVFQGSGYVQYNIPRNQKYIEISCSEDGFIVAKQRYYVRNIGSHVSFTISEYMRYSSGNKSKFN